MTVEPLLASPVGRELLDANAAQALIDLSRRIGIRSLSELGFKAEGIPEAAELIIAMKFPNPRPVNAEGVRWILERALG